MTRIAIAYHSGYGHTKVLASSVAQGVRDAGVEAVLLKIDSATQITIHGINVEQAGAEADQNQANIEQDRMQQQEAMPA